MFGVFVLPACHPQSETSALDADFAGIFSVQDLNRSIKMELAPYTASPLKFDTALSVQVVNLSHTTVRFAGDYGVKIYIYVEALSQWQEIKNTVITLSNRDIVLDPSGGLLDRGVVTVKPAITNQDQPVTIRLVVAGESGQAGAAEISVGAYLDLVLQP